MNFFKIDFVNNGLIKNEFLCEGCFLGFKDLFFNMMGF